MSAAILEAAAITDLVELAAANPVVLFTDEARYSEFYEKVKAEVSGQPVDLTTDKGRKAVAARAFRVTKAKTTLDKAGKGLTEKWRQDTAAVNAARNKMTSELDRLAEEVRRPLTEWEIAEDKRISELRQAITCIQAAARITQDDTSASVEERGRKTFSFPIGEEFGDMQPEAEAAKAATVAALHAARDRLRKEEVDRAELEELRAAAAARQEQERIAAEQREVERVERERVEAERVAAERAEQRRKDEKAAAGERLRIAAKQAFDQARAEEIARAQTVEADRQRAHDAQLADERRQREEVERQARADREQREQADRDREAEQEHAHAEKERVAAEDRQREANRTHRARVKRAAKEAIMTCGASEDAAQKIVLAIIAGEVPAVALRF